MKRTLPLANRRVAVLLNMLSYPLMLWFFTQPLQSGILLGSLLAVGFCLVTALYLFYRTHLWAFGNAPDEQLDERQNMVRNYAYRYAYIVLSTLVLGLLLYYEFHLILAGNAGWLPTTDGQASALFFCFLGLTLVLPSAILAWNEREV